MKNFTFVIGVFIVFYGNAQKEIKNLNKNKVFIYWGWNRGYYMNSDIHFTGDNYDFTLEAVTAKDRQTPFALDPYFHPARITIPQTNFKAGFFFKEKYNISFGVDHMKYVMNQGQTVKINGHIEANNVKYNETYNGNNIVLTTDFLTFEHTDGLNYINVEANRFDNLFHLFGSKFPIDINFTEGIGLGVLLPRTNAKLMQNERNDEFHLAGFGLNLKAGFDISIFRHFFFRLEAKGGYINMPDIRTTPSKSDRASQDIFFFQRNLLFGVSFKFDRK